MDKKMLDDKYKEAVLLMGKKIHSVYRTILADESCQKICPSDFYLHDLCMLHGLMILHPFVSPLFCTKGIFTFHSRQFACDCRLLRNKTIAVYKIYGAKEDVAYLEHVLCEYQKVHMPAFLIRKFMRYLYLSGLSVYCFVLIYALKYKQFFVFFLIVALLCFLYFLYSKSRRVV